MLAHDLLSLQATLLTRLASRGGRNPTSTGFRFRGVSSKKEGACTSPLFHSRGFCLGWLVRNSRGWSISITQAVLLVCLVSLHLRCISRSTRKGGICFYGFARAASTKEMSGRWGDRPLGRWGWREPCSEASSASAARARRAYRFAALASSGPANREAEPTSDHASIFWLRATQVHRTLGPHRSVLSAALRGLLAL